MILFSMVFHTGGSPSFFVALSIIAFWAFELLKARQKVAFDLVTL
jgi:hypothetical protein